MPHLSSSQLDMYLQCPTKWRAHYIEHVKGEPSKELGLGGALHNTLEDFGRWHMLHGAPQRIDLDELLARFEFHLRTEMAKIDPLGTLNMQHPDMLARGRAMLTGFVQHVAPRYRPVLVEDPFDVAIPGLDGEGSFLMGVNQETGAEEKWTFTGRIDAQTETEAGPVIMDWKTAGKPWWDGAEHKKGQATAYMLAQQQRGKPLPHHVAFVVFAPEWDAETGTYSCYPDIRVTKRTSYDLRIYVETLQRVALEINAIWEGKRIPQPTPSALCPWCPKVHSCYDGARYLFLRGKLDTMTPAEPVSMFPDELPLGTYQELSDAEVAQAKYKRQQVVQREEQAHRERLARETGDMVEVSLEMALRDEGDMPAVALTLPAKTAKTAKRKKQSAGVADDADDVAWDG